MGRPPAPTSEPGPISSRAPGPAPSPEPSPALYRPGPKPNPEPGPIHGPTSSIARSPAPGPTSSNASGPKSDTRQNRTCSNHCNVLRIIPRFYFSTCVLSQQWCDSVALQHESGSCCGCLFFLAGISVFIVLTFCHVSLTSCQDVSGAIWSSLVLLARPTKPSHSPAGPSPYP